MYSLLNICYPLRNSVPRLAHYENVRWFRRPRKPFWLGIAPSKKFVVKEPKRLPELEHNELKRLQYLYNRQYTSLMDFMSSSNIHELFEKSDNLIIEESFTRSLQTNDAWNEKSDSLRREREKREAEEVESALMEQFQQQIEEERIKNMKIDKLIDDELALSQTYVTKENLDLFIENCLENVVDYNYAIDLDGNIYKGDSVKATDKEDVVEV